MLELRKVRHKLDTYPISEPPGPPILTLGRPGEELRVGNAMRNGMEGKSGLFLELLDRLEALWC